MALKRDYRFLYDKVRSLINILIDLFPLQLNGDCSNGSVESDESSPSSVASPLQGNTSGGSEAATMTEPESLGPCEPGTAVKLQGIVWQETDKGGKISFFSPLQKKFCVQTKIARGVTLHRNFVSQKRHSSLYLWSIAKTKVFF